MSYRAPVSGSTVTLCAAISRVTAAFLLIDWISDTLNSALPTESALTGNDASLGMSCSSGSARTPSNRSSKVCASNVPSSIKTLSAVRSQRFAAAMPCSSA